MKTLLPIFLLTILIVSCTGNNSQNSSTSEEINLEEEFWTWFESKSDEYYHFEDNQYTLFSELKEKLNEIDENLTFVFGTPGEDERREFIISADGIKSSFPAVESLVESAPDLRDWKIIAFRPRAKTISSILVEGLEIGENDIMFEHYPDLELIGIKLYIRNYDENDSRFISAAFIMLDNAIGEYDTEMKIGEMEFLGFPDDTTSLIPFSELAVTVDSYFE